MNRALWAIRLSFAWRKISSSTVTGTRPHWISSLNTFPAPTLGSWSGSPTRTVFAPFFSAEKNLPASHISTMENSSTMTKSASRLSFFFVRLPSSSSLTRPSPLCMVHAPSNPVLSAILRLARPVGAIRTIFPSG